MKELGPSLKNIVACQPYKLFLVTTAAKHLALKKVADLLDHPRIRIQFTANANKRRQVCTALPHV
jgi:hypothetical protein